MSADDRAAGELPVVTSALRIDIGPIPPAAELARYESIEKGMASRIVALAERQSKHRQKMEEVLVRASSRDSFLGILCGLAFGLSGLILTGFCVYVGHGIAGTLVGGGTIGSIVFAFIYGTRWNRRSQNEGAAEPRREGAPFQGV